MKITDKNKPTITELRTSVAQRLDACVKGTGDLEALKADELKRSGECAAIEASLEYDEAKGIQALETKKAQLELLRKRIASLEGSCSVHLDKLNGFMSGVHEVMGPALSPAWREEVVEIARVMLPFFGTWDLALRRATETRRAQQTAYFYMMRNYGRGIDPIGEARQVLAILDALLEGKDPMPWPVDKIPDPVPYLFPWERQ